MRLLAWLAVLLGGGLGLALACNTATFSAAEAGVDAGASDSPQPEAGGDGAAQDPCMGGTMHLLCDDFDKDALAAAWTPGPGCPAGRPDPGDFVSPPNSLLSAVPEGGSCSSIQAHLLPAQPPSVAHCEFDVREDGVPVANYLLFSAIVETPSRSYYELDLDFIAGQLPPLAVSEYWTVLNDGGSFSPAPTPVAGPSDLQAWHHVSLQLDFTKQQIEVALDRAPMTALALQALPAIVTSMLIQVGVTFQDRPHLVTLRHDNVVCDFQ